MTHICPIYRLMKYGFMLDHLLAICNVAYGSGCVVFRKTIGGCHFVQAVYIEDNDETHTIFF